MPISSMVAPQRPRKQSLPPSLAPAPHGVSRSPNMLVPSTTAHRGPPKVRKRETRRKERQQLTELDSYETAVLTAQLGVEPEQLQQWPPHLRAYALQVRGGHAAHPAAGKQRQLPYPCSACSKVTISHLTARSGATRRASAVRACCRGSRRRDGWSTSCA